MQPALSSVVSPLRPRPAPEAESARPVWIAVDSDGCVLDSMGPKHRGCFVPALIETWSLEAIAALATDGFLWLNLRSKHRGTNRFRALGLFWSWLKERVPPEVFKKTVPPLARFNVWVQGNGPLSEATLKTELARHPQDSGLALALKWSRRVNELIRELPSIQPFENASKALALASKKGLLHVVSSGSAPAIQAEWRVAGLHSLASGFHAQETGSKASILHALASRHGRASGLMIGDSVGDADAALAAGVPFYPILPEAEAESWRIFTEDILPSFCAGRFGPAEAQQWRERFQSCLDFNPADLP